MDWIGFRLAGDLETEYILIYFSLVFDNTILILLWDAKYTINHALLFNY